ncbi:MAG: hydrogenase maturation protease, partial [Ferruginibacter sp.]
MQYGFGPGTGVSSRLIQSSSVYCARAFYNIARVFCMSIKKTVGASIDNKKFCIVGIGNSIRSDDGAGAYICQQLEEKNLPGVTVIITQQLDIGMTEDFTKFEKVIFVDATLKDESITFRPLTLENNPPGSFSHHINAAMLVSLARR